MSLTTTTLASAVTTTSTTITVASATSFVAGQTILVDQEVMLTGQAFGTAPYTSTVIPVLRGRNGSATAAHASGANVITGTGTDWSAVAPAVFTSWPLAGRARILTSYTAAGAITLPSPGNDAVAVLNGTSVLAMTLANPTKDMDGCILTVIGNGAASHTITYTAGLGNAGSSYDVLTANGTGLPSVQLIAINGYWTALHTITGTLTNIGWAIA